MPTRQHKRDLSAADHRFRGGAGPGCGWPPGGRYGERCTHNPVMASRHRYLTTRQDNPLTDGQARAAIAAALLRWLHVITTRHVTWDAHLAGAEVMPIAA